LDERETIGEGRAVQKVHLLLKVGGVRIQKKVVGNTNKERETDSNTTNYQIYLRVTKRILKKRQRKQKGNKITTNQKGGEGSPEKPDTHTNPEQQRKWSGVSLKGVRTSVERGKDYRGD